jgi:hypothetical protein
MAKKKAKKKAEKTRTAVVREWAPGQPFDSPKTSTSNTGKKVP